MWMVLVVEVQLFVDVEAVLNGVVYKAQEKQLADAKKAWQNVGQTVIKHLGCSIVLAHDVLESFTIPGFALKKQLQILHDRLKRQV